MISHNYFPINTNLKYIPHYMVEQSLKDQVLDWYKKITRSENFSFKKT
jgi:hypothetical protein